MSFIKEFDLSEETAASFAAGMLKVANADGMIHPKEKVLIEQFSEGLEVSDIIDFSIISEGPATESFMLVTSLVAVSDGEVADSEQAIILDQVENGVAIRMAVMYLLASKLY